MIERTKISDGVILVRSDLGLKIRVKNTSREYSEATEYEGSEKEWEEVGNAGR